MAGIEDLYREIILDHYRAPRNRGELPVPPAHRVEGFNPLCGDEVVLFLEVDDGVVSDVRTAGQGCSISQASTSMMSAAVKGKTVDEARKLIRAFKALMSIHESKLEGESDGTDLQAELDGVQLGDLEALQGVVKFPVRIKCATLPWHTLRAALEQQREPVSTEQAASVGQGAGAGPPGPAAPRALEQAVIEVLRRVYDPEIPVNVYDLGLIYDIAVDHSGVVGITMTLTSPTCPVAMSLVRHVESKVASIPGVAAAKVKLVWDPPWNQDMMSEAARLQLGL